MPTPTDAYYWALPSTGCSTEAEPTDQDAGSRYASFAPVRRKAPEEESIF